MSEGGKEFQVKVVIKGHRLARTGHLRHLQIGQQEDIAEAGGSYCSRQLQGER